MKNEIESLVQKFVKELNAAMREVVLSDVRGQLEAVVGSAGGKKGKPALAMANSGKRTAEDLEKAREKILAVLAKNPGASNEQLQKLASIHRDAISLPLNQLVKSKAISFKGVARGRKYWVR